MLTLILGGAGSGKTRLVYRQFREAMEAGRTGLVLLTPEQQSHRAERELAAFCGPALSLHGEVLSFTRLYSRAAAELGGLADPIPDRGARLLLLALALEETAPLLRQYGDRGRRGDWLPQLLDAVEELESSLTEPEALMAAAEEAAGSIRDKLYDLALVQQAYRAALDRRLGDSRDRIRRLADMAETCSAGSGGLWADGFTDFTAAELEVLDALLRRGSDLTVALPLPDWAGEDEEAFRLPENTFRRLTRLASLRGTQCRILRCAGEEDPAPALRRLAEGLYRYGEAPAPAGEEKPPVELMQTANFSGECRYAAARILELLRQDPSLRFGDFAVAAPDYGGKGPLLEAVFREYGIPFFVEETTSLGDTGLAAFVLDALNAVSGGFAYRDVFACLKSGLAGLTPGETDRLENYCLLWNIRGEGTWGQEAPWDRHPRGYVSERTEADEKELAEVDALRRKAAAPLLKLSGALKQAETGREYLAALTDYLLTTDIRSGLSARAARLEELGDLQAARDCLRQWDALCACLDQFWEALGDVSLEEKDFLRLLELLLRNRDMGSIPAALDCVSLGSPGRLRGRKPRVLLLLGAEDSALPGAEDGSGFFSPEERRALFDLGLRLEQDREEGLSRRLYDLYQIAAAPRERLIVSFSGPDARPSFLQRRAMTLLGAVMGREEDLGEKHLCAAPDPLFRLALAGGSRLARAAARVTDRDRLERVRASALRSRGNLSSGAAAALYGRELRLTASRTETFYTCRYRYFLQYGLKAAERKTAGFQAPELGTFLHFVLEGVCREAASLGGFRDLGEDTLKGLTEKYTDEYVRQFLRPAQMRDPRFRYLFTRLRRSVDLILRDVTGELAASRFTPMDFELRFGLGQNELPPLRAGDVSLGGVADRVDGWLDGDTLYLCIADYKTGKKTFSLTDVWYGLGIQMLLYLFALEADGPARYGVSRIVPAGVLYAPARDLFLDMSRNSSPEEIAKARQKALKRSGLLLADVKVLKAREEGDQPRYIPVTYRDGVPTGSVATLAQLGQLAAYVKKLLERMGSALRSGSIQADPLCRSGSNVPCDWCPYTAACAFQEGQGEDRYRQVRSRTGDEFWQDLGREAAENG